MSSHEECNTKCIHFIVPNAPIFFTISIKEWVSFFFSRFIIAVRNKQIAWTAKRFSCDLFVPHCDSFPMNREKDTHSLYLQCLQQRSLLRFSEQSKKFKFPSEIGNMTWFPDIKQNSAWINREKGDLSCMFLIHINSNNVNSILKLN